MNNHGFLFVLLAFLAWPPLVGAAEISEKDRMNKLERAFDQIKGCYWIKEDLLNPTFQPETKQRTVKKSPVTSMITGVHDSRIFFHPKTKKPMKEVYLSLMPGNTHPGRSIQLIIDPDSYGVKGQEIRGNFIGPILNRDTVGKTDEELKAQAGKPEEPVEYRQEFVATGKFSSGLRLLINSTSERGSGIGAVPSLYSYALRPAKREECVNEEILDHGLPAPDRKVR